MRKKESDVGIGEQWRIKEWCENGEMMREWRSGAEAALLPEVLSTHLLWLSVLALFSNSHTALLASHCSLSNSHFEMCNTRRIGELLIIPS